MNLSVDEIQKMKVVELRAELNARGLDSKGVKAVLVDRLIGAMDEMATGSVNGSSLLVSREPSHSLLSEPDEEMETGDNVLDDPTPLNLFSSQQEDTEDPLASDKDEPLDLQLSEFEPPAQLLEEDSAEAGNGNEVSDPSADDQKNGDDHGEEEKEAMDEATAESQAETQKIEAKEEKDENGTKRKIEEVNGGRESCGFKKRKAHQEPQVVVPPLNEPEFDENLVLLDWYKSDLNLKISTDDFLSAEPLIFDEFPLAFAGAFGSWGFKQGKICFEVKWKENSQVKADFEKVENEAKHILRVGWSDLYSGMQLGEQKFSYGFDSRGKFFNGGEVTESGEGTTFAEGDTICAYLDLESDSMELKFTKNGETVGEPILIPKEELNGTVWYPHILSRNVKFEANFGEKEPSHPVLEGFQFLSKVTSEDSKVRGPIRPASKDDCEFVMLCGLACCGKTTWAKEHSRANPDKHYNILGTSTVVERAVSSPGATSSPIEGFLQKAGKFVEKLIEIAPSRKRNYILDQSNVNHGCQQRKSGGFEGFRRRAVLILPSDEEYQKRIKAKEQEQGKSVPKSTILDMKANYEVPVVGALFSVVEFPELGQAEAEELISKYNKEGSRHHSIKSIEPNRFGNRRGMPMRGGRGGFRGGRGGPPRGGRGFFRGGDVRGGGGGRGAPWRGRGSGPPMFAGGRGGPPSLGPPRGGGGGRGIAPLRGGPPRPMFGAGGGGGGRGMRGGSGPPRGGPMTPNRGSFGRGGGGGGGPGAGNQGRNQPRGGFGGGRGNNNGGNGPRVDRRGNPGGSRGFSQGGNNAGGGGGGGRWGNSQSGFGNNNRRGGGGQGGFQQPWGNGGQQNWGGNRSGNNSGFGGGGGGGGGFGGGPDPWAVQQQVPDQGYGLSWENGGGNQGGGGGTWQGYGGQTFGNFGYGRK